MLPPSLKSWYSDVKVIWGQKSSILSEKKTGATTPPPYTGTRAVPESAIKDLQCSYHVVLTQILIYPNIQKSLNIFFVFLKMHIKRTIYRFSRNISLTILQQNYNSWHSLPKLTHILTKVVQNEILWIQIKTNTTHFNTHKFTSSHSSLLRKQWTALNIFKHSKFFRAKGSSL